MELVKQIIKVVVICEILKFAVAFVYYPIAPIFSIIEIVCIIKILWDYFKGKSNNS